MIDSGYDISDFKDIDPTFGTIGDIEKLIAQAKKLGIKDKHVILDLVPNHTSDKHEWFRKSLIGEGKYKDYYIWKTGNNNNQSPPNNWISDLYLAALLGALIRIVINGIFINLNIGNLI
ncbi:maltase 1-like [Camponotus floridanus]|uniref:maltase 1-like n=1 Tax=Camponotus floridanus TaxID=104421 RepID=UPI000DC6B0A1|nr:maltase 1-like [Camponotus floridanus]